MQSDLRSSQQNTSNPLDEMPNEISTDPEQKKLKKIAYESKISL